MEEEKEDSVPSSEESVEIEIDEDQIGIMTLSLPCLENPIMLSWSSANAEFNDFIINKDIDEEIKTLKGVMEGEI